MINQQEFDGSLNTFTFDAGDAILSARRRGLGDYQAGPLRLIAPRGSIEGVGNVALTGSITGTRLFADVGGTNPLPTLAGGAGSTPNVTAEIGNHAQGSVLFGTSILSHGEIQAQALNVVQQLDLNPQGGGVSVHGVPINTALFGWTAFTPVITQSVTVTKTVAFSRYVKLGRLVIWMFNFTITGAGTAANHINLTLPFTSASASGVTGGGYIFDASAGTNYIGLSSLIDTTHVGFVIGGTNTNYMGATGGGFTAGLANTDSVLGLVIYEATT